MNKTRLKKYAHLIANAGLHVQKGQEVRISAALDQPEFVRMVVEECYRAGAKNVTVQWDYQPLTKLGVRYRTEKSLSTVEDWEIAKFEHQADTLPATLYLDSEDPDGLAGVNVTKMAKAQSARAKKLKPIRDRMENRYQWCIAAVPGKEWAKKVFPGERTTVAVEKLWEAILSTSRVSDDPMAEWDKHNKNLAEKCEKLNALGIRELHYTSSNGTDLRVGMIPEAVFCAGGETTLGSNVYFNPNIPSEEVFTSPMRGKAEGIVYSALPLSHNGQLIDNFWVKFEGGRAVDVGAEKGEAVLREIIGMDEGAAYLGECALVPFTSPIRASGILFYNTLFDENAACHLALGRGFSNVLRDYEKYTEEQAHEMGINDSVTHVDFMIGSRDLNIDATTADGRIVPIFRGGEWAI